MKIISFDIMKLCKDTINAQPVDTLIQNIIDLVQNNFPGVTHIAISVPLNSNTQFVAQGNKPSPRTPEAFTDFLLDVIHTAGYSAIIRSTDCNGEGIYNFPYKPNIAQYWINEAVAHLTLHKGHLKNGDIAAYFPEFEGQGNGFGINVTDNWQNFYEGLITAINQWSQQNGIQIQSYTTINESEANSGWYNENIVKTQNAFVIDYYPDSSFLDELSWITNFKTTLDTLYNKYGNHSFPLFLQETGDTRSPSSGTTQQSNPQLTADLFTQIIYPYLQSGELIGINFWNLFDTPQEGILTIDENSVSLNAKGQALAKAFQAINESTTSSTPSPSSNYIFPAFTGIITSDGKGTITIKQN